MMLEPSFGDADDSEDSEPYDLPRGRCPHCGAGGIVHLVIGMPTGPRAMAESPPWVWWVGCLHPGYNRRCPACWGVWTESHVGEVIEPVSWGRF